METKKESTDDWWIKHIKILNGETIDDSTSEESTNVENLPINEKNNEDLKAKLEGANLKNIKLTQEQVDSVTLSDDQLKQIKIVR